MIDSNLQVETTTQYHLITFLLESLRPRPPPGPPSALRKCYAAKLGKNVCWFPLRLEMCGPPKISDYMVKLRGMDHHW